MSGTYTRVLQYPHRLHQTCFITTLPFLPHYMLTIIDYTGAFTARQSTLMDTTYIHHTSIKSRRSNLHVFTVFTAVFNSMQTFIPTLCALISAVLVGTGLTGSKKKCCFYSLSTFKVREMNKDPDLPPKAMKKK